MSLLRTHGKPLYGVQPVAGGRECILRDDVPVMVLANIAGRSLIAPRHGTSELSWGGPRDRS